MFGEKHVVECAVESNLSVGEPQGLLPHSGGIVSAFWVERAGELRLVAAFALIPQRPGVRFIEVVLPLMINEVRGHVRPEYEGGPGSLPIDRVLCAEESAPFEHLLGRSFLQFARIF